MVCKKTIVISITEIQFGTWEHMILPPEKHFDMFKKFEQKISRLRINMLRAHIKSCEKPTFFVTCVKKINKTSRTQLFLTEKFVFFTNDTQNIGFLWNHFVNV
jgi:hypothetical protein